MRRWLACPHDLAVVLVFVPKVHIRRPQHRLHVALVLLLLLLLLFQQELLVKVVEVLTREFIPEVAVVLRRTSLVLALTEVVRGAALHQDGAGAVARLHQPGVVRVAVVYQLLLELLVELTDREDLVPRRSVHPGIAVKIDSSVSVVAL